MSRDGDDRGAHRGNVQRGRAHVPGGPPAGDEQSRRVGPVATGHRRQRPRAFSFQRHERRRRALRRSLQRDVKALRARDVRGKPDATAKLAGRPSVFPRYQNL